MTRELRRLLTFSGPAVWLMVAAPVLLRRPLIDARFGAWAASYLAFALAFVLALRTRRPAWLVVQAAAVVGTVLAMCDGFEGALLVLVALQLGGLTSRRVGLCAVGVQSAALGVAIGFHWSPPAALLLTPPYLAFQLLAFFAAEGLVRLEAAEELRLTNGRLEERLRISRELHDRLGHHLAALNLNLEAAARSEEALQAARQVGRVLLAEVREAVADLRDPDRIDVCSALRTLAEELPMPRVHVDAPSSLPLRDPQRGLALLRCAQEIVTNAARHSSAKNLWFVLTQEDGALELRARDDGSGAAEFQPGNGLRGMRERIEAAGGTLLVRTAPGEGFSVRATLPRRSEG
jgi:signal transduction histidine kinase